MSRLERRVRQLKVRVDLVRVRRVHEQLTHAVDLGNGRQPGGLGPEVGYQDVSEKWQKKSSSANIKIESRRHDGVNRLGR